jgi:hypothetical protein
MADNIDPINQKVAEFLSYGVPEEEIVAHLSKSKDEKAKLWVQKWKSAQTTQRAEDRVGGSSTSDQTSEQSILAQAQKWASENPITTAAAATTALAAGGAIAYGLKERIRTNAEIRKEKKLAEIESPAVKIQRDQLEFNKQKFQAEQDALIKSETQNVISKTKADFLNDYAVQKYGAPLADLEKVSGGKLKTTTDVDVVGGAFSKGGGITVNPAGAFTQPSGYAQPNIQAVAPNVAPTAVAPTDPLASRPNPYMTPSVQEGVETGNTAKTIQSVVAKEIDQSTGMYRDAQGNMVYPKEMSPAARTGAEVFSKQYPDIAKTLEGKGQFAILGAGSGDNSLFNSYDSELMKKLRNEVNQGQMVGPDVNYTSRINPAIQAISPETALGKELADLKATQLANQSKGGTSGKLGIPATIGGEKGGLMKAPNQVRDIVKAGGPALLLMAMADAAKAAQQGRYGEAAIRSADVATDYIPMLAQLKQGLSPTEAGAPTVSKQAIESAALLGSPYAQTEWAKKQRLKEKAGAGRGIAPPSAYMR